MRPGSSHSRAGSRTTRRLHGTSSAIGPLRELSRASGLGEDETAGISALAAILFVIPPLLNVLPSSWDNAISPYLPSTAGQAVMQIDHPAHTLAPWTGLGLFAAYTAVLIGAAAILLKRRDV